jgi:hypothetical protein
MNPKGFSPEDEKSPLPPFIKGGFEKSPFEKGGFRGIWFFTVKPAAAKHLLTANRYANAAGLAAEGALLEPTHHLLTDPLTKEKGGQIY